MQYFTLAEAARIAKVSRQRIHRLQRTGTLGTVRLQPQGRPYVPELSLRMWMQRREAAKATTEAQP